MASGDASREELINLIEEATKRIKVTDLEDFTSLMSAYSSNTPVSFRELFAAQLFRQPPTYITARLTTPSKRQCNVEKFFCLPLLCTDVFDYSRNQLTRDCKVIFVDCRPDDQYEHSGALPNAFRFNALLMQQDPTAFNERMNALLALVHEADEVTKEKGDMWLKLHVCFCSSGFPIEDSYSNMLIAHCLQRKVALVSIMYGGMRSLHNNSPLPHAMLKNHDEQLCIYCHPPSKMRGMPGVDDDFYADDGAGLQTHGAISSKAIEPAATSLFGRLSGVVKQTTYKMAETGKWALLATSTPGAGPSNASNSTSESKPARERQLSASGTPSTSTKPAKNRSTNAPYRAVGTKVFSIDDDNSDDASVGDDTESQSGDDVPKREEINLETWLCNKPDVRHTFACHLVLDNGFLVDAHLLATDSHFFILRHQTSSVTPWWRFTSFGSHHALMAVIHSRQPINKVVKILAKRSTPDLISFYYGDKVVIPDPEGQDQVQIRIIARDRLLIPKSREVLRVLIPIIISATNAIMAERTAPASTAANVPAGLKRHEH